MLSGLIGRLSASEGLLRRVLTIGVAIGFAALIAAIAAALWLNSRNAEHRDRVRHTYDVELAVDRVRLATEQSETVRRGYVLSGQQAYLDAYAKVAAGLPGTLDRIRQLTADNAGQQARIALLERQLRDLAEQRLRTIALTRAGRRDAAVGLFGLESGARRMRGIRDNFDAMIAEEQRLLVQREATLRGSVNAFVTVLVVAGILLALVAGITLFTILRYVRDLGRTSGRLSELNDSLEDQVQVRTADLTRANEEIQRFAYIVSHDLRSPLVNVMGFTAELDSATKELASLIERAEREAPQIVTHEARVAAREDLPEAIDFIRTSTAKMDRLINAILKLSREGRRVLSPEPIDMTALIAGIRDSLVQLSDERGVEIAITPLPAIVSDRVAIEQIFSNLVENATKYSEPGRRGEVVVRGARVGAKLVYEVVDNGRGIDPKDHGRIFDLFRRSGRQDTPGEGIGLAHARALAIRLGGSIDIESRLGEGATFRVSLPTTFDDQEDSA